MRGLSIVTLPCIVPLTLGCTNSELDALHESCLATGMVEQMEGMQESDRYSVEIGVETGCTMLVDECKSNPEGKLCVAFKNKYP